MSGARLEKPGGVFAEIRRGVFRAENDADVCRSFAAVEWHYSERLLGSEIYTEGRALVARLLGSVLTRGSA
jgi:hypothetical protein